LTSAARFGTVTAEVAMITCHPLTPDRWDDFVAVFGARGACAGCWCMWWKRSRQEWEAHKGAGNRRAMRAMVMAGEEPGLLAYDGGHPVGWCAIAPRERYATIERSRILARRDDVAVWSLPCLFVVKEARGQGVALALTEAAVAYARAHGAPAVEAYPTVPRGASPLPAISSFMGTPAMFERAGFVEIARVSPSRAIMRRAC
jgi:GNAT superfamily N-acetyltransferase